MRNFKLDLKDEEIEAKKSLRSKLNKVKNNKSESDKSELKSANELRSNNLILKL